MKRYVPFLLILLVVSGAVAQDLPPSLMIREGNTSVPLALAKVETLVRIVGMLAETRTVMTFHNPNSRQLAGDLYFPLPEGSTVSGYGLDVNGVLVDGVAVEKDKGREVFEQEVRKGVDPGLVEWVKGNNFKTRVFPIPAHGNRTVMVKYVSDLTPSGEGYVYHLPLRYKEKVDSFSLRVEVIRSEISPVVKSGDLKDFSFKKWQQGYSAETTLEKEPLTSDLRVAIPDIEKQPVLVEKSPKGQTYFCLNHFLTGDRPTDSAAEKSPSRITIFWDASASREKADHSKELRILREFFALYRSASIEVSLVFFRNDREPARTFKVSGGDLSAIEKEIAEAPYDGGTQMGCLSPAKGETEPDFYLLFSDGVSNFGQENPTGLTKPLYAFSGDSTANHSFLRFLALQTGGDYFNLNQVEAASVAPAIGKTAFAFLGADIVSGDLTETFPRIPKSVHDRFTLAGVLNGESGKIKLRFGFGDKVQKEVEYEISAAKAPEGDLLERYWAQKKVEDLMVFPQKNEKEITSVGKRFGIVTPNTSLIVLERLDQYVQHEIVPPSTMPQWRKEYFEIVERKETDLKAVQASKLEEVVRMWNDRVAWWNTEFEIPKDFVSRKMKKGANRESSDHSQGAGGAISGNSRAPSSEAFDGAPLGSAESEEDRSTGARPQEPMPEPESAAPGGLPSPSKPQSLSKSDLGADSKSLSRDKSIGDVSGQETVEPGVAMKAWTPDTPYLKRMKEAGPEKAYSAYLKERKDFGNSPAFFLDCSDYFFKEKVKDIGLRVLSNIAEMELENPPLMRILAHRLAQIDELGLSAMIFEEVLKLRPEEPQSYRDLALVLGRLEQFPRAVQLLYDVVLKRWDGRFPELEVIALEELNNLVAKAKAKNMKVMEIDPRLLKLLECDIRIVMTWDADMTDMDLWVLEPSGEKAYYGFNRTAIGGLVSRDFTRGYGPEEYLLKRAMKGMYTIQTNFFGSSAQTLSGAVTLQVDVFSNYCRPNEKRKSITLRLTENKETFTVGEMEF